MSSTREKTTHGQDLRILVINPGSTTTKMAVYENETPLFEETIHYGSEDFAYLDSPIDQCERRTNDVLAVLDKHGIAPEDLNAVVGRGGLVRPLVSGTYLINDQMMADLASGEYGMHACNLGGIIARTLGDAYDLPAYVVDPVVVDELWPQARVTGIPGIVRRTSFHALNSKAVSRRCASELGRSYEECNFVVAHMGGGVTVSAHRQGRVVDVNNAIEGEGPMSPERCGGAPLDGVIRMCFDGKHTQEQMVRLQNGTGGIKAYLGTSDMREVETMIDAGSEEAALLHDACAYQIAKEIGAMVAALDAPVDAIILTGGLAKSDRFVAAVQRRVERLAPVFVYPGEDELLALAQGALRVLRGEEKAKTYGA